MKIGFVTPLTGGASFLGTEQLSWAQYAAKTIAPKLGLKVVRPGDVPAEAGPAPAQALAQKFVADKAVIAILGPSTSGSVAASSDTYFQAHLMHVSPSATRTSLTKGSNREATGAFLRVIPGDYVQGPTDAKFMINQLKAKKVVIMDFQEPYSVGLADAVETTLKAGGVSTTRLSAPNTTTDYSAYVTKVPADADIVFFPTQKPPDAQTFAQQLLEQGKKAKVFGGDGSNAPSQFKVPGAYVSNFAPDISGIKGDAAIIAGWKKDNPGKELGSFGPPTYGAVQVELRAIKNACTGRQGLHHPSLRPAEGQAGRGPELDPRRHVPLLDEVERPAEREVLRLPDPVERHVQALWLERRTNLRAARPRAGPLAYLERLGSSAAWTPTSSFSSPSTH